MKLVLNEEKCVLADLWYGDRMIPIPEDKLEFMKEVTIHTIDEYRTKEIVNLKLNASDMYQEYKDEYNSIREELPNKITPDFTSAYLTQFGCFLINRPEKKCIVTGVIQFRAPDCLEYIGMFLYLLNDLFEIDVTYALCGIDFLDHLTVKEKKIQLYKYTLSCVYRTHMNDDRVIDEVKKNMINMNHEYKEKTVFWND